MIIKTYIHHMYRYHPDAIYCEYNDIQIRKLSTHDFKFIEYDPDDPYLRVYKCKNCDFDASLYMTRIKRFTSFSPKWERRCLLPRQVSCDEYRMKEALE